QSLGESFGYTASDGVLTSAATLTITIHGADDPPMPADEAFDLAGNTELRVDLATPGSTPHTVATTSSGTGVLDNDADPDGGSVVEVAGIVGCGDAAPPFDCVLAGQGRVVMEAGGAFRFIPEAGDTDATASFQYLLAGNPANPGTVTFNRFERVWYVDGNAAAGGDGTSAAPFDGLAALDGAGGAGDVDAAGDWIFIHAGNVAGSLPLEGGQRLLGEGVGLSLPLDLNGVPGPVELVPPGTAPVFGAPSGTAVSIANA